MAHNQLSEDCEKIWSSQNSKFNKKYYVLPNKTKNTLVCYIFQSIISLDKCFNLKEIMVNFEKALVNAIQKVFRTHQFMSELIFQLS